MKQNDGLKTTLPATDWDRVHRRLEMVRIALDQGTAPAPAQKQLTLKARARAMAQEPVQQGSEPGARGADDSVLEVVEFRLAHESYGLELRYIREVYPLKDFTPIPCTPPFVLGIVNVRGQLFSILDLKKFFDLPEKGLTDLNQVIILQTETMEFGVLADAVLGVRRIARQTLQTSLPTLTGIRADFFLGITPEQLIILDAGKLLSNRDIIVYEEVEA